MNFKSNYSAARESAFEKANAALSLVPPVFANIQETLDFMSVITPIRDATKKALASCKNYHSQYMSWIEELGKVENDRAKFEEQKKWFYVLLKKPEDGIEALYERCNAAIDHLDSIYGQFFAEAHRLFHQQLAHRNVIQPSAPIADNTTAPVRHIPPTETSSSSTNVIAEPTDSLFPSSSTVDALFSPREFYVVLEEISSAPVQQPPLIETSLSPTNVFTEPTVSLPPSSSTVADPFASQQPYVVLEDTSSVPVQKPPHNGTSPSATNVLSDPILPAESKPPNQPSALVEETCMQQPSPIETPSSATTVIPDPNVSVTTAPSPSSVAPPVLLQQSEAVKYVTFDPAAPQNTSAPPSEKLAFKESPNVTSVTDKGEMLHQQQFDGSFSSSFPQGGGWLEKSPSSIKDLRDAHRFFQKSVKSRWKFKQNSECKRENSELHTDPTTQVPRGSKLSKHHVDAILFHYLFKQPMKAIIKDYREPSSRCLPPLLCCRSVRKSSNEFPVYPFSHKILPINPLGEQPGQIEPYKSSSVQPEKPVLIASLEGTSSSRRKWKAVN